MIQLTAIISQDSEQHVTDLLYTQNAQSITTQPHPNNQLKLTALFLEDTSPELPTPYTFTLTSLDQSQWQHTETFYIENLTLQCPNTVFGNNNHPTTKLMIQALKTLSPASKDSFLDIGCGSGLLTLIAAQKPYKTTIGIDIDPTAIQNAKNNAKHNQLPHTQFQTQDITIWNTTQPFTHIAANLPITILEPSFSKILTHLSPQGILILSGFTSKWSQTMQNLCTQNQLTITNTTQLEDWQCLITQSL